MSERDWCMLMDWRLGDPLADIYDWMLFPIMDIDKKKRDMVYLEQFEEE